MNRQVPPHPVSDHPLPRGGCKDRGHGGQVCGDMVDTWSGVAEQGGHGLGSGFNGLTQVQLLDHLRDEYQFKHAI